MKFFFSCLLYLLFLVLTYFPTYSYGQENPFDSLQIVDSAYVYFDFGKSFLRPRADTILQKMIHNHFGKKGKYLVNINAHTDSIGSIEANQVLSQRRAKSVQQALMEQGIPESRIRIDYYGESLPYASNRDEKGRQLNRRARIEWYEIVPMVQVTGHVYEDTTKNGISAKIIAHHKAYRDSTQSDSTGFFSLSVRPGHVIGLDVFAEGYFFKSRFFRVPQAGKKIPTLDFQLERLRDSMIIPLKNFYFVGNKAILLEKSKPELPKLLRFMQFNDQTQIEIAGHVNHPNSPPLDTTTWEYKLSQRRAKMVFDYLVKNGVNPDRMTHKGYGNWEMVYPHAVKESDQAQNRRVEIRVKEAR